MVRKRRVRVAYVQRPVRSESVGKMSRDELGTVEHGRLRRPLCAIWGCLGIFSLYFNRVKILT